MGDEALAPSQLRHILATCKSAIPIKVTAGTTIRADPCHKKPLILVLASYGYDLRMSLIAVNRFVDQRRPGYRTFRRRPHYMTPQPVRAGLITCIRIRPGQNFISRPLRQT